MMNELISNFRTSLIHRAKRATCTIAFPDALDLRVLQAAKHIQEYEYGNPILIGKRQDIQEYAKNTSFDISTLEIRDPEHVIGEDHVSALMQAFPGVQSIEEARHVLMNPLYFAGIEARLGALHGCIAGNLSTTGDVIRAGLKTVGLAKGIQTVSSFFAMEFPDRLLFFADCAVVPSPTTEQLCDIAAMTAYHYKSIVGMDPKIAFLSFSTKGSSKHEDAQKVRAAFELFNAKNPDILADGELQIDAALIPAIAKQKAAGSVLEGDANVLIFPDLDAGNIAYKISERLANARAIGPIVQGLSKPYCDLSRGCSMEDIVDVALMCMAM